MRDSYLHSQMEEHFWARIPWADCTFCVTPHDKIYAVPSGGTDLGGQFKGYIGQYYQNDTALLLGKMKYDLELDNGLMISGANKQSWTTYYDDFLPVTATEHPELETRIFSFAPILEKEAVPASSIHPVPGPAGAFYCIEVKIFPDAK